MNKATQLEYLWRLTGWISAAFEVAEGSIVRAVISAAWVFGWTPFTTRYLVPSRSSAISSKTMPSGSGRLKTTETEEDVSANAERGETGAPRLVSNGCGLPEPGLPMGMDLLA